MVQQLLKYSILICLLSGINHFAQLKDGTYQGFAKGRTDQNHDGEISIEMRIADGRIDSINVLKFNQSINHKKYGKYVTEVLEKLPKDLISAQSIDVDIITGATISSNALLLAVARAHEQARPPIKDGIYSGSTLGRRDKNYTGEILVSVKIKESKFDSILINSYDQSIDHRRYGESVRRARTEIPFKIINNQSLDVDGVSGATISSNALILAVARALENAE